MRWEQRRRPQRFWAGSGANHSLLHENRSSAGHPALASIALSPKGGVSGQILRRKKDGDIPNPNDLLGRLNFFQANIRPDGNCLYVVDSYTDEGVPDAYEFSILIQRASDGALGIIDPPIVHEDDYQP